MAGEKEIKKNRRIDYQGYKFKKCSDKETLKELEKEWKESTGEWGQSLYSRTRKYLSDEDEKF